MATRLDDAAILEALKALPNWQREGESIVRDVATKDFRGALALVNAIGEIAEEVDHHPDLLIHGWNRVRITLSTHSAGGLTVNDFQLAERIEHLIDEF